MNIELYIGNKLCDLEKSDLSIRLKRQFINPAELNIKDAQKSYNISLPSTPVNDEIFKYKNVEETDGKFTIYPDARLYVNGILILDGKFRLSEITRDSYKGNLGVPAPLTVKDIFGEKKMNEIGEWRIPFEGEQSITTYNIKDDSECLFPLVLYGLLPKSTKSDKEVIDNSVNFKLDHFPPSVNCMKMLQHWFKNSPEGYKLSGTALNDERLSKLYVSYRNPEDYVMPFGFRRSSLSGSWSNIISNNSSERKVMRKEQEHKNGCTFMACDIFQSDSITLKSKDDPSSNLTVDGNNITYTAPIDGLYKIDLGVDIRLPVGSLRLKGLSSSIDDNSKYHIMATEPHSGGKNLWRDFRNVACEIKLLRYNDEKLNLDSVKMDNDFHLKNRNEKVPIEQDYFPENGNVHFIDPYQNADILCGFSWGRMSWNNENRNNKTSIAQYENPLEKDKIQHNPIAIQHGKSWDGGFDTFVESAVNCPEYKKMETAIETLPEDEHKEARKFEVNLENATANSFMDSDYKTGNGQIQQVVYLKKDEKITLVSAMDMAQRDDWIFHQVDFRLNIEPTGFEKSWLKMDTNGNSNGEMDWNDEAKYLNKEIDLVKFLPSTMKVDEWIENFCKTFNLEMLHKGDKRFELNAKKNQLIRQTAKVIDVDQKANVSQLTNQPFSLPYAYDLGFELGKDEEGYYKDEADGDSKLGGGGMFYTGGLDKNISQQKSNFSYCWYKKLTDKRISSTEDSLYVPVITNKEIWEDRNDYQTMETKRYTDLPQRFWYKGENVSLKVQGTPNIDVNLVTNSYMGNRPLSLDYEDKPNSIMNNYFMLFTNQKEYTLIECYLTPDEYDNLDEAYIKFNGDLYITAEVDGYDPARESKTKLKLIKKA